MAETTARAGLTPQIWSSDFFTEYVRQNKFKRYMGTDPSSIIQVKEDLTRKKGDRVTFATARAIGGGVTGNTVLEGNEAELDLRSLTVQVTPVRNAVVDTEWDEQKSEIDILDAGRAALKVWSLEKMREDIIIALKSLPNTAGVMTNYENATAAERNTFLTNNADRILFGSSVANGSSNVWATALATIDNTSDKLTASVGRLAKRLAENAYPAITPTMTKGEDEEWSVMFCNPFAFRDLQGDPEMIDANKYAAERGKNNPLFTGGDLIRDGIIYREIQEMGTVRAATTSRLGRTGGVIAGAGAGGIQVGFNFLVGAQAIGAAWARRLRSTTDVRDYGFRHGSGVIEVRGIQKLMFGTSDTSDTGTLVQNGVVTVMTAAVADS